MHRYVHQFCNGYCDAYIKGWNFVGFTISDKKKPLKKSNSSGIVVAKCV